MSSLPVTLLSVFLAFLCFFTILTTWKLPRFIKTHSHGTRKFGYLKQPTVGCTSRHQRVTREVSTIHFDIPLLYVEQRNQPASKCGGIYYGDFVCGGKYPARNTTQLINSVRHHWTPKVDKQRRNIRQVHLTVGLSIIEITSSLQPRGTR